MLNSRSIENAPISECGKLVGYCRNHIVEYMKNHKEPIRTQELLKALEEDAPRIQIPSARGNCTRREAYKAALTSLRQERHVETDLEWYMVWHEYAQDDKVYRGRPRT